MREGSVKTYRVSRVLKMQATSEAFTRPRHFDLAAYWQENAKRLERDLYPHRAKLRVTALGLRILQGISPTFVRAHMEISDPDDEGN